MLCEPQALRSPVLNQQLTAEFSTLDPDNEIVEHGNKRSNPHAASITNLYCRQLPTGPLEQLLCENSNPCHDQINTFAGAVKYFWSIYATCTWKTTILFGHPPFVASWSWCHWPNHRLHHVHQDSCTCSSEPTTVLGVQRPSFLVQKLG